MALPNLFNNQSNINSDQLFLAISLTETKALSGLWRVAHGQIEVLKIAASQPFTNIEEELIQLDQSLQDLGPQSEKVSEVLFSFEPKWVTQTGLIEAKKGLLKKITSDLSLTAVGFVVTPEAYNQYLIKQNPLISTVVIYCGQDYVQVSIIKQGQVLKIVQVGRSDQLETDLKEVWGRLPAALAQTKLPASLYLASVQDDEATLADNQQRLIEEYGSSQLFIQPPTIKIIAAQDLFRAVILEGGTAVAREKKLLPEATVASAGTDESLAADFHQSAGFADSAVSSSISAEISANDRDQLAVPDQKNAKSSPAKQVLSFGLPIQPNFLFKKQSAEAKNNLSPDLIGADLASPVMKHKRQTILNLNSRAKWGLIGGGICGLLALVAIGYFYLKSTYQIVVELQPAIKTVSQETTVILDPSLTESLVEELKLKANLVNKSVSAEESAVTTGVKLVGDEATGKVIIYNKTDQSKKLAAGTKITSDQLVYTLDKEVEVESAEAEENDQGTQQTKKYGQIEAAVTAAEIGADYNLKKDATFKIGDYATDTFSAKAVADFSGGSSREIRVVSEKDQTELAARVVKKILTKASDEFSEDSKNGQYYLSTTQYQLETEKYSAAVGEEQEEFSLAMTLKVAGINYQTSDLQPLAKVVLAAQVPAGYELLDQIPEVLSQPAAASSSAKVAELKLNLSAKAQAQLDPQALAAEIYNLPLAVAQEKLVNFETINTAEVTVKPFLAKIIINNFPDSATKIIWQIKSN